MGRAGDHDIARSERRHQRLPELVRSPNHEATGGQWPAEAEGEAVEMLMRHRCLDAGSQRGERIQYLCQCRDLEIELTDRLDDALGLARRARCEEGDDAPLRIDVRQWRC